MRRTLTDRRGGFTLVELLVVITIISILFALTAAAVTKAMSKGEEVRARSDISQLAEAFQAFKTQYNVSYVPDLIVLPPGYDPTGLTAQYFKSLWPRLNPATLAGNTNTFTLGTGKAAQQYNVFTYWLGPGAASETTRQVLHGDQALVFFLGGAVDASGNCVGFSTDQTNPMQLVGARHGPFYDNFTTNRLKVFAGSGTTPEVNGLLKRSRYNRSYIDTYGAAPYLYFSSYKSGNDYAALATAYGTQPGIAAPSFPNGAATWVPVTPFMLNATRFANPSSFQILCAGKDAAFGTGGLSWAGATGGAASADGYDDMANFHPLLLGIANQ